MSNSRMAGQSLGLVPEDLADVGENMTYNPAMASGGKDMGNVASVYFNVGTQQVTGRNDGMNEFHVSGGKFGRRGFSVKENDLENKYQAGTEWATNPTGRGYYGENNGRVQAVSRKEDSYKKFGNSIAKQAVHDGRQWQHSQHGRGLTSNEQRIKQDKQRAIDTSIKERKAREKVEFDNRIAAKRAEFKRRRAADSNYMRRKPQPQPQRQQQQSRPAPQPQRQQRQQQRSYDGFGG